MSGTAPSKRVALSLKTKLKVLQEIDLNTRSKTEIAKEFKIPKSSLSTIIKNREKILKASNGGIAPERNRTTEARYPKMETALLDWLKLMRSQNVPVDGNFFKAKAETFALRMSIDNEFNASDGWLHRFKARHGLSFKKLCGESASVDMNTVNNWKENELRKLLKEYAPKDIFNADETGLFFKALPDRTLVLKGESCSGGKQAKERITMLLTANMDGSEKLPLFVIGKSKKPRCFKGIRTLPCSYRANKKAWMIAVLFEEWLRNLDMKMVQKKRKILLIVDNCSAHEAVGVLQAIRLEFLPPNVTSVMQPMDQGVIQAFKKHYRKNLLHKVILNLENGKDYVINILGAIHLANAAWNSLTPQTIANCFRHAGFSVETITDVSKNVDEPDAEGEELMSSLRVHVPSLDNVAFEEYANLDVRVECTDFVSEEEIIERAVGGTVAATTIDDESSENEAETVEHCPTQKEASDAAEVLRRFFERQEHSEDSLKKVMELEKDVFKSVCNFKQPTITGYFKKV